MMIASLKDLWVICTPTKTGTYSLEGTLIDRANVAYKIVPRHSTHWPVHEGEERILIVRHPLDRWASMYWFIKKETGKGIWGEKHSSDINTFCEWWATQNNFMWTYNLSRNCELFKPDLVFRQEEGFVDLLQHLGVTIAPSHRNKVAGRPSYIATIGELSLKNYDIVMKWAEPDLKMFYADTTTLSQ